jgi:hypothetical protein
VAQFGIFYFIFAAPWVAAFLAVVLSSQRHLSPYHRLAFHAAALYVPVWIVVIALLLSGVSAMSA